MDQETNTISALPVKKDSSLLRVGLILLIGLVAGFAAGYFIRDNAVKDLQDEITSLKSKNASLQAQVKAPAEPTSQAPTKTEYKYGIKIPVPTGLGSPILNEAIIPLGTSGTYTVQSTLYNFDENSNIRILVSTDAIVYENFIRYGTQAITPNPNTLTPGNPLLMNGVKFCPTLSAKSCVYDEETNTAVFEKEYLDSDNNPYSVWGSIRFFPVSQSQIGKTAAVVITRVTSNNQQLIDWAKEIGVNSKR